MEAWKESGPGALGFTGATEESIREIASEGFLVQRLASPSVKIVVAEANERILGFASSRVTDPRGAELSGIVVLKEASGKGLGSKMLHKACNLVAKAGFKRIVVKTEAFNKPAIEFYKKNGFNETSKTTEKVGRTKVPVQVLERRFR
jgi:ribosomal protein S18 acetylase RimI-like enzyme